MGRNGLVLMMAVLLIIGCLAMTTECRVGAGSVQANTNIIDAIAVNSTSNANIIDAIAVNSTSVYGDNKRNAILCGLKACVGNGGELYKCYCCVRPGLTCFPSEDDCVFKCR